MHEPERGPAAASGSVLVSVVIPVRNVTTTIDEQLAALEAQTYRGRWEVVVADNGSTDATRARVTAWEGRVPDLRCVEAAGKRGVAHARNVAIHAARGDMILICDGDDVVDHEWVRYLAGALKEHALVTGFNDFEALNRPEQFDWMWDVASNGPPRACGFLPYAHGGNLGLRRGLFDALTGFNESLRSFEDVDFGWRARYAGVAVHFEPRAVVHKRLRPSPMSVWRSALAGGMAEPVLYKRHRRQGMRRAQGWEVVGTYIWLARSLGLAARPDGRHRWASVAGNRLGRAVGSMRRGVRFL